MGWTRGIKNQSIIWLRCSIHGIFGWKFSHLPKNSFVISPYLQPHVPPTHVHSSWKGETKIFLGFYADERNLNFNVHETDSRASEKGCGMLLGKFAFCYGSACTAKRGEGGSGKGQWMASDEFHNFMTFARLNFNVRLKAGSGWMRYWHNMASNVFNQYLVTIQIF